MNLNPINNRGLPVVVSAPSGGGKSTIVTEILNRVPNATRSISCTTRSPRAGEKEGVDYFFVTEAEFKKRVSAGEFLEWAVVHNYSYGTPASGFEDQLKKGKDVVLTIDPQGAASVRKIYPDGVFIFVVPPTWDILSERLQKRASDNPDTVGVRLTNARKEVQSLTSYDYLVVNDDLSLAVSDVAAIIQAEHHRLTRINKRDIPILHES